MATWWGSLKGGSERKETLEVFNSSIDPAIYVYTNKKMLVGVYLDKSRVSDTPESAETVISETP